MNRLRTRSYPDLKTWRKAMGFNQREAAKFLGITQSLYARLELGYQPAKGKIAKLITEKTGVPLEVLVGAA
jgi:transcriptional regulator with XRE-family HTH domain